MDVQKELQKTNIYLFEEFEYEDDAFYSELRKQVLQLTAEDDDDENNDLNMVTERKQGVYYSPSGVSQDTGYYNWSGNKEDFVAPAWMLNLWRTGNGTGVFIPQIVQAKKKNRSRRKKNERGRTYKRVEKI